MAYLPLSTANLPDPVINPAQGASPEDYFVPFIYTGNGADRDIDIGMAPDLVWIKRRNQTGNHMLFDKVRGANKVIYSHLTAAEETLTDRVNSFNSDGWTTGNEDANVSGHTYVAWNWKANGSGVTNTDGSITSTVSANTTSGFSVGTFVGNQTAGATVGHGLSQAPEMIIIKDRPTVNDWPVYHASISPSQTIKLNSANAAFTESTIWNNTAPTASVFTLGGSNLANNNTKSHVFYAFHSVDGFSRFGSYVGNGSTDGPFVYTGFRPAFVMIKRTSTSGANWYMTDDARYDTNRGYGSAAYLYADTSAAEMTTENIDMLSNGFKLRRDSGLFNYPSGDTFIYMAFAENPFKYSNAR